MPLEELVQAVEPQILEVPQVAQVPPEALEVPQVPQEVQQVPFEALEVPQVPQEALEVPQVPELASLAPKPLRTSDCSECRCPREDLAKPTPSYTVGSGCGCVGREYQEVPIVLRPQVPYTPEDAASLTVVSVEQASLVGPPLQAVQATEGPAVGVASLPQQWQAEDPQAEVQQWQAQAEVPQEPEEEQLEDAGFQASQAVPQAPHADLSAPQEEPLRLHPPKIHYPSCQVQRHWQRSTHRPESSRRRAPGVQAVQAVQASQEAQGTHGSQGHRRPRAPE